MKTDGPDGIWRKHIEIEKNGDVATDYNKGKYLNSGNEQWKEVGTTIGAFGLSFSADNKDMPLLCLL